MTIYLLSSGSSDRRHKNILVTYTILKVDFCGRSSVIIRNVRPR